MIYNRGGNREFGAWSVASVAQVLAPIASWGYVVVASQYRGNAGGEGTEEFGGRDVNDVVNLLPLLQSVPQADTDRVGMYGWSRGGMMTYLALTRTDRISAAVVGAGMADLFDTARRRPEMERGVFAQLIPEYTKDRDSALAARSAVRIPRSSTRRRRSFSSTGPPIRKSTRAKHSRWRPSSPRPGLHSGFGFSSGAITD